MWVMPGSVDRTRRDRGRPRDGRIDRGRHDRWTARRGRPAGTARGGRAPHPPGPFQDRCDPVSGTSPPRRNRSIGVAIGPAAVSSGASARSAAATLPGLGLSPRAWSTASPVPYRRPRRRRPPLLIARAGIAAGAADRRRIGRSGIGWRRRARRRTARARPRSALCAPDQDAARGARPTRAVRGSVRACGRRSCRARRRRSSSPAGRAPGQHGEAVDGIRRQPPPPQRPAQLRRRRRRD